MKQKFTDLLRAAFIFMMGLVFATACSETGEDVDDTTGGGETKVTIKVDTKSFDLTSDSSSTDPDNYIVIMGESDASWTAKSSVSWLDLSAKSGKAGDIEITVSPNGKNDTGLDRDAEITLTAEGAESPAKVTITQKKDEFVETVVTFDIDEATTAVAAEGGAVAATITSNIKWYAASSEDWVSVKSSGEASADAVDLEIEVEANLTTEPREAKVTITYEGDPKVIEITQDAAAPSVVVTKDDAMFTDMSGGGASASISILANTAWSIASSEDWVTFSVAEGVASTESVEVKITVGANSSDTDARPATVTIKAEGVADQTIAITQTKFSLSQELETLNTVVKPALVGESGVELTGWGSLDLATWQGVTSVNGSVTKIELSALGLTGVIPAEIGAFSELETLDLADNSLTGSVPVEFENLSKMTTFKVKGNALSGIIPSDVVNNPNFVAWNAIDNIYPQAGQANATAADVAALALKLNATGILRAVYWHCGGPDWTYSSTAGTGIREGVKSTGDLVAEGFLVANSETASGYEPEWLHDLDDGLGAAKYSGAFVSTSLTGTIQLVGVAGSNMQAMRTMSGVLPAELGMQTGSSFGQIKMDNCGIEGLDVRALSQIKFLKLANCPLNMDINDIIPNCLSIAEANLTNCALKGVVSDATFDKVNEPSLGKDGVTMNYVVPNITNNADLTGTLSRSLLADKFGLVDEAAQDTFVTGTGITLE